MGLPVACAGRLRRPCSACRGGRVGGRLTDWRRAGTARRTPNRPLAGLRQLASADWRFRGRAGLRFGPGGCSPRAQGTSGLGPCGRGGGEEAVRGLTCPCPWPVRVPRSPEGADVGVAEHRLAAHLCWSAAPSAVYGRVRTSRAGGLGLQRLLARSVSLALTTGCRRACLQGTVAWVY
jgi:hypothetical protein